MNKIVLFSFLVLNITVMSLNSATSIYAEKIGSFGTVNEILISDDNTVYFFERDVTKTAPTWEPDTNIMIYHDGQIEKVSDSLFIFPTEFHEYGDTLFFAALSPTCIGMVACDYQDIFKMSKTDGSYEKIIEYLKSAIHISVEDEILYATESNGIVWKMEYNGHEPMIIYEGVNLIMDVTSDRDTTYWIEEESDLNSHIMMKDSEHAAEIIQDGLQIPYDLEFFEDALYWNNISVEPDAGTVSEITQISKYQNDITTQIQEFQNTSPITKSGNLSYGPYLAYGDFIIVSNNTNNNPVIQLIDTQTDSTYDLIELQDYKPSYFEASTNMLYIVGQDSNGFVIEQVALPIPIPEFSEYVLGFVTVSGFASVLILAKKFSSLRLET